MCRLPSGQPSVFPDWRIFFVIEMVLTWFGFDSYKLVNMVVSIPSSVSLVRLSPWVTSCGLQPVGREMVNHGTEYVETRRAWGSARMQESISISILTDFYNIRLTRCSAQIRQRKVESGICHS